MNLGWNCYWCNDSFHFTVPNFKCICCMSTLQEYRVPCGNAEMRECVNAWMRECKNAWMREFWASKWCDTPANRQRRALLCCVLQFLTKLVMLVILVMACYERYERRGNSNPQTQIPVQNAKGKMQNAKWVMETA